MGLRAVPCEHENRALPCVSHSHGMSHATSQNQKLSSQVLSHRLLLASLHWNKGLTFTTPGPPQSSSAICHGIAPGPVPAWVRTCLSGHSHHFSQEFTWDDSPSVLYVLYTLPCNVLEPSPLLHLKLGCNGIWFKSWLLIMARLIAVIVMICNDVITACLFYYTVDSLVYGLIMWIVRFRTVRAPPGTF